ncbi:hypothetical protein HPB49_013989 [Dermacentor silvarum]|uniref:Uncharacterized protein n=1 Tax=Dermacentor silvarum TaxID=543639 RepID=A0ACB8DDT9_DERSI|nr:hypothetical protein HPB49_013989 [Dermacentor silvarum]
MASTTADEAASAAAAEADACGDDAGNQQYGDPWDTDQAAVALRLLRAEDNRKSPTPAHATPAAKGVPSTNEEARQPVYEAAFDLRRKQREPDQGLDRMVQSPVPLIPGLQQQQLADPLHPVPSSCSSSEVSLVPGRRGGITGQPSLRDACCPGPPPHQGSSGSISVSSSVQLQPTPTPRGSSGSDGGRPSVPIPATGYQGLAFKQASAADKTICQNDPLPCARSSISENTPAAPIGAIAVKRNIHAGVKVRHSESVRRPRHGGHRNKAEPMALAPVLLNMFRVNPGRVFLITQSEVTQPQATSGTQLYHCTAAEIAGTSGFVTAVSQNLGDNAYEIIGPDDESPQGANDISVAEVSPIPLEVTMTDDTAAIDTETAVSTTAATVYVASSSLSASAVVSEGTEPGLLPTPRGFVDLAENVDGAPVAVTDVSLAGLGLASCSFGLSLMPYVPTTRGSVDLAKCVAGAPVAAADVSLA